MGKVTGIAYADSTINPVVGCAGCGLYNADADKNLCYAATMVRRYAGCKGWPKSFTQPEFFEGRLEQALRWPDLTGTDRPDKPWLNGMPRVVFLCDLGDIFAPNAPDPAKWLAPRLGDLAASPHIWLILTKWPQRMSAFFKGTPGSVPKNVWPGTTITGPETGWRLRELAKVGEEMRGVMRWLSLEPLLGRVCLWEHSPCGYYCSESAGHVDHQFLAARIRGPIKWVVVGGASGRNAPPMHPDWTRLVRDECELAGVPLFFKQWG